VNLMNFCNPSPPYSMACESIDQEELLKLINLNNNKLPGPDIFGPVNYDCVLNSCMQLRLLLRVS